MPRIQRLLFAFLLFGSARYMHFLIWPKAWFAGARFHVGSVFYSSIAACSAFHLWWFRLGPTDERVGAFGWVLSTWTGFVLWCMTLFDLPTPGWLIVFGGFLFFLGLALVIAGERLKQRRPSRGDDPDGPLWLPRGPRSR